MTENGKCVRTRRTGVIQRDVKRPGEGGQIKSSREKDAVTCPHLRGGGRGKEFRERDEKKEREKQRGDVKEGG